MIAVERPAPDVFTRPHLVREPAAARPRRARLTSKLSATILTVALLVSLGGSGGLFDSGIVFGLQARAVALHAKWAEMRANGIPDSDLASLEQEWAHSQQTKVLGVGSVLWWPGAGSMIDRWDAQSEAVWARDLALYRAGAVAADQSLHRALGTEVKAQRKARLDALGIATTPAEFAVLRSEWDLEARLVPIDRNIALLAGAVAGQAGQAKTLGIRNDPAAATLTRADGYGKLGSPDRMATAELLTRSLIAVRNDLQGRIAAATVTQQAFTRATNEVYIASLYGIDLSSSQSRVERNRNSYASALTVAEFNQITGDLNQIAASADRAVSVALSTTHVIAGITFIYQNHPLSCEEASTSMALTHQGIYVSQDQILAELGADRRPMSVDSSGRVRWGNPYETFVGNVDGSESNFTGYGTYYPPLVRIAKAHGAKVLAYGTMSAATIYARVIAGHPVVAFATWDWAWHPRRDYLSFDGQWIPFIGPAQASHVYVVAGVSPGSVLIDDPIRGQYWISKGAFEAGYSDFNEAIVFA